MICKRHRNHTGKWREFDLKNGQTAGTGKATKSDLKHGNILGANEHK